MKVSIKEIKVEDDGTEILYIRDFGFILKSETFSGAIKCRHEKEQRKGAAEKGNEKEVDLEAIFPILPQIIAQFMGAQQHQAQQAQQTAERERQASQQPKEPATEGKKPIPE